MLEIIDLWKIYKTRSIEYPALRGVNLRLERGEFLAVVGPSGSGKTTLLNLIGALDVPTRGEIILDGVSYGSVGKGGLVELRRNKIGFIFQTYNLLSQLTSLENVELPLIAQGVSPRVMALQSLASTISSIIGQFGLLLGSIAGISLTVAGLGIMNIMMISVIERTKEIGVMKAVGYRDREVLLIFIVESFMIGILGGLLGIGLGTAASYIMPSLLGTLFRAPTGGAAPASTRGFSNPQFGGTQVSSMFSFTPVISPEIVFTAYGFAIMISVIAGIYPAWRASRLDPIRAIRYE
ncbi:MAG: FtsX-like permease family protein [Nitrososphaerota archaeon]